MDGVVEAVIRLARSVTPQSLSSREREGARRVLLDSLGCAMAAFEAPGPTIARKLAQAAPGLPGCSLIGERGNCHGDFTAFANGSMIRYLDFNDSFASPAGVGHPSDYIPAVLVACEESSQGGSTITWGIALVYELFAALTDATHLGVEGVDHVLCGDVAAAAAAGVIWGLDDQQLAHAVSLALVPNFGLQATRLGDLSMWKGCAAANACRNGLFAARLARAGLSGPTQPFTGRGGMEAVFHTVIDAAALEPGQRPLFVGNSNLKRYPSGYFSQGAIDAAIELRQQIDDPGQIRGVHIGTFEYGSRVMAGDRAKWHPTTRESADHSLPYVVATALVHGDLGVEHFTDAALADPRVAAVLEHLTVEADPECVAAWPEEVMTKLEVTIDGGHPLSAEVQHYRGHGLNPMSNQEIEAKVERIAGPRLGPERLQRLFATVWGLEQVDSVADLLEPTWMD